VATGRALDASTVPAERDGKRQHVVEVLNTVAKGTSILVEAQVRADFNAETTLQEIASLLRTHGLPQQVTFDRDVRFVSSPQGSDYPSAKVALLSLLGRGRPYLRPTPAAAKRLCGAVSSQLARRMPGTAASGDLGGGASCDCTVPAALQL
jgi:hypothetical protein